MRESRVSLNALAYLFAKIAPALAGVLLVPVLVRSMDALSYTRFGQSMAIVNALIGFSAGWINQAQMRFAQQSGDTSLHTTKMLAFVLSAAVGSVALGVWSSASTHETLLSQALLYVGMLAGLMATTEALAIPLPHRVVAMELLRAGTLVVAIGTSIVAFNGLSTEIALISFAASYLLPLIIPIKVDLGRPHRRANTPTTWIVVRKTLRQWWRYGWPLGAWICLTSLMQVIDRVVVETSYGASNSAQYIALFEIYFRGVSLLLFPAVMASYPEIIRRWTNGQTQSALALARNVGWIQAALLLPIVLACLITSTWISLALGMRFSGPVDQWVIVQFVTGAVIWQIALVAHKPLELLQHTGVMLACAAVAFIVFIISLCFFRLGPITLVPSAYITSGLAYVVLCLLAFRLIRK